MEYKILIALYYSIFASAVVNSIPHDAYNDVFTDFMFWGCAALGLGMMLTVDKKDDSAVVTTKQVVFSILASIAIVFLTGSVKAELTGDDDYERSPYFYAIVIFLCAISPTLVRNLINDLPDTINEGVQSRVKNIVSGKDNKYPDNVDYNNEETDIYP